MEAELVAAAVAMKEAVFCANMMNQLGFGARFDSLSLYTGNASALHVADIRSCGSRGKHVALRYGFIRELAESSPTT